MRGVVVITLYTLCIYCPVRLSPTRRGKSLFLSTSYCASGNGLQQQQAKGDAFCIGGERRAKIAYPLSSDASPQQR
jgi:hypothetical protein